MPLNREVHNTLNKKYYDERSKDQQSAELPASEERVSRFGYGFGNYAEARYPAQLIRSHSVRGQQ